MDDGLTLSTFDTVADAFAVEGLEMRTHKGRSVVRLDVEGRTHYLKRFWLCPTQILKRQIARGLHEIRMIDWLNGNGFAGPRIVRRGVHSVLAIPTRTFFLMEEVPDELTLEATWRQHPEPADALLDALASFAARLHDAGFYHTDFSERHILVGRANGAFTFRLIDIERARVGKVSHTAAAGDLATLSASVSDPRLRDSINTLFVDRYLAHRSTLPQTSAFRDLLARATPTRSFH